MNRRAMLKALALGAAAAAAEKIFPGVLFANTGAAAPDGLTWKKAPCRFCGTGCGVLIGLSNGRAVSVKGDPASPVNKGLCCVKGYHSVMALYGADRLKQAYVRKNGAMTPVPIQEALDLVAS